MSNITKDTLVGQIVAERPARSRIFEKHGIDYCCGGRKALSAACKEKQINPDWVIKEIQAQDNYSPAPEIELTKVSLTQLCDHIVQEHHEYLKVNLPRLNFFTNKVARSHGEDNANLVELDKVLTAFRYDLETHMMKEEEILFPLCKELDNAVSKPQSHCESVQNPIRVMVMEHDNAGADLAKMRELTNNYTPHEEACNTFRALYQALEDLEQNMHHHVHKENNILFPRAIEKEAAIAA